MLLMVKQEIFDALLTGERRRFDVRQTQQTTAAFRNLGLIDVECMPTGDMAEIKISGGQPRKGRPELRAVVSVGVGGPTLRLRERHYIVVIQKIVGIRDGRHKKGTKNGSSKNDR